MIGRVLEVHDERLGGEVAVSAAAGDTALYLDDVSDFNEDGGEFFTDNFASPPGVIYTAADYDANTLATEALSVAVAADLQEGDWVLPYSADHEDTERIASVDVGDGPELTAVVTYALRSYLPVGTREPGHEEIVEVAEDGGEVRVVNVRGAPMTIEWGGGAGHGYSQLNQNDTIWLAERLNDPLTPPTGYVKVYSKVVAGTSKLFAMDDGGGVHALW